MTQGVLITIAVVLGWIVLAAIQRRLQGRHRNRAFWARASPVDGVGTAGYDPVP